MTKLLFCPPPCWDIVTLHVDIFRPCRCGRSAGMFLDDGHHALLIGPAIALGTLNEDLESAVKPHESGYYMVRTWKIPDGERIIRIVAKTSGLAITTPCSPNSKCQPCPYRILPTVAPAPSGKITITVEVKKHGAVVQTLGPFELVPGA